MSDQISVLTLAVETFVAAVIVEEEIVGVATGVQIAVETEAVEMTGTLNHTKEAWQCATISFEPRLVM